MENIENGYYLADSARTGFQLSFARRWFKVGAMLLGGTGLVLLSILALSVPTVTQQNSTALFSLVNARTGPVSQPFIGTLHRPQLSRTPADARKSIKAAADYRQGDSAEYYSASNGDWVPCKVVAINSKGEVKVSVKQNEWLSQAVQDKNLRKKNTFLGFSFGSDKFKDKDQYARINYKDADTGPGYSWDSESMFEAYARVREDRKRFAERERMARQAEEAGGAAKIFAQLTGALDFKEDIKQDRGLLAAAKQLRKGEKMTQEEYGAVKRKVGGTKDGFFGEQVDVIGEYTDKGYVDESAGLPKWMRKLR